MTWVFHIREQACHHFVIKRCQYGLMDTDANPEFEVDNFPARQRSWRVAVVTETYPPEVNGVALTLARLVEGLRSANHDVQLVRPRQSESDQASQEALQPGFHEVLMRGLPIPRYPELRMGLPSKGALIKLWQLRRPDVVHIATEGPLGWSALRAALYLKLPISTDYRTNFQSYSAHYGVGFLHKPIMGYLRKFHNRAHCTMVPTKALMGALAAAGFHKLKVVSRGVDTAAFDPAHRQQLLRTQWGLGPDDLAVLCVGRLAPEKNLKLLVQAYQLIKQRVPRARLVLVGQGPLRQALQEQCPDAIFTGQLRGSVLATHYASADLFLMPSMTETFGNVTTEAMASGLPVLAFNDAAAAEWLSDDVNGRVVALRDAEGFISAALELASQPSVRARLGQAARHTALQLDWSRIVQQFEGVLQEVMHQANISGAVAVGHDRPRPT
jgi:glycosyltransferase involved in cell wall biosynthesis